MSLGWLCILCFFFFKQKTAYEMRISDWSSDVCSSDLDVPEGDAGLGEEIGDRHEGRADDAEAVLDAMHLQHLHEGFFRRHLHLGNSFSWPWRPRRQGPPPLRGPRGSARPCLRRRRGRSKGPDRRALWSQGGRPAIAPIDAERPTRPD